MTVAPLPLCTSMPWVSSNSSFLKQRYRVEDGGGLGSTFIKEHFCIFDKFLLGAKWPTQITSVRLPLCVQYATKSLQGALVWVCFTMSFSFQKYWDYYTHVRLESREAGRMMVRVPGRAYWFCLLTLLLLLANLAGRSPGPTPSPPKPGPRQRSTIDIYTLECWIIKITRR